MQEIDTSMPQLSFRMFIQYQKIMYFLMPNIVFEQCLWFCLSRGVPSRWLWSTAERECRVFGGTEKLGSKGRCIWTYSVHHIMSYITKKHSSFTMPLCALHTQGLQFLIFLWLKFHSLSNRLDWQCIFLNIWCIKWSNALKSFKPVKLSAGLTYIIFIYLNYMMTWPVQDEHFGIVPIEAMAAYKPVIACNSGGPVESIKNGVTGYLCEATPQDFSTAMCNFVKDPQLSRAMGIEARKHVVESFSTKTFGHHLNAYVVDTARRKQEWRYEQWIDNSPFLLQRYSCSFCFQTIRTFAPFSLFYNTLRQK